MNVSSSGPGKQPDVFKYTILEASSWRPFRPLNFVLRALRVLRSCDPTHAKLSPEWPYTSVKIYFHNISTFKEKRHQSTAYIFMHVHSSFDIHCLISIVGQHKILRKNSWYSKYLPSLTHAQSWSWINVESIQSLRLTSSQLRHRKRELHAEAMMIPERKTCFQICATLIQLFLDKQLRFADPTLSRRRLSSPEKVESNLWSLLKGDYCVRLTCMLAVCGKNQASC